MQDKYTAGNGTYVRNGYVYASIVGVPQPGADVSKVGMLSSLSPLTLELVVSACQKGAMVEPFTDFRHKLHCEPCSGVFLCKQSTLLA